MAIYVYPHDCDDFSTTGLVGEIKPIEATFTEEKNSISHRGKALRQMGEVLKNL